MTKRKGAVAHTQEELLFHKDPRRAWRWGDLPRETRQATVVLIAKLLLEKHVSDRSLHCLGLGEQGHE